jgi:peptidoglycan/LPS O-acetylase OafA/YrhL
MERMGEVRVRLNGVDSIRFISALFVVLTHLGSPPLFKLINTAYPLKLIEGFYNNLFSGPAAVIVFFVISGLCINFPYASGKKLDYKEYYFRRYVRIAIPMIAALIIANLLKVQLARLTDSILWSLYAELIYYTIFPLLILLKERIGWNKVWLSTFVIAYVIIVVYPSSVYHGGYPKFGIGLNWVVGLPCWLLGVILAEKISETKIENSLPSFHKLIFLRLTIWVFAVICSILRYHFEIGYSLTLNIFAIAVYFWLYNEIIYYKNKSSNQILEWAGKWSYSLYLCHLFSKPLVSLLTLSSGILFLDWFIPISTAVLFSYLFYVLIERPSHKLANKGKGLFDLYTNTV